MMLTIHGLPISVKYHDLKVLIKENCSITDYILDSLVSENDGTKKVRIGLADDREGSHLIKCLDGFRMGPNILRVRPIGKPQSGNAPQNLDQRGYPPRNDYPSQQTNFSNRSMGRPEPMGRPDMARSDNMGRPNNMGGPGMGRPNNMGGPDMGRSNNMGGQDVGRSNNMGRQNNMGRSEHMGHIDNMGRLDPMGHPDNMGRSDPISRPDPWGNQWNQNQHAPQDQNFNHQSQNDQGYVHQNVPQRPEIRRFEGRDQFSSRMPAQQGFGEFGQKNMSDNLGGPRGLGPGAVLRSVEVVDTAVDPRPSLAPRFQPRYDPINKPVTIMKDNFQGPQYDLDGPDPPNQYSMGGQGQMGGVAPVGMAHQGLSGGQSHPVHQGMQGHSGPTPGAGPLWNQPIQQKVPYAKASPNTYDRKFPETDKRQLSKPIIEPSRPMIDPGFDKSGPRFSPRRDISGPSGRTSPGRRPYSPGRRLISPGRRPVSPGSRVLSSGTRLGSPGRRLISPGPLRSPVRRLSPDGRRDVRRSPYSRDQDKYTDARNSAKLVRPAYDAPSQAFSSGGYRPSIHENVQYPTPGMRQDRPWDKGSFVPGKKDDDRIGKYEESKRSPRKSRSPVRRERSPHRYSKHSPSPRSPRRSWANEKRRTPDINEAPPPPLWPVQTKREDAFRTRFDDDAKPKHTPVWEPRRLDDDRFDSRREPSPRDRFAREPKFEPRDSRDPKFEQQQFRGSKFEPRDDKFETRGPKFEPRDPKFEPRGSKFEPREPKFEPREPKFEPRDSKFEPRNLRNVDDFRRADDLKRLDRDFKDRRSEEDIRQSRPEKRPDFSRDEYRREGEKNIAKMPDTFTKEFEDVYKRAQELNKRAEELRRREERRKDELEDNRDSKNYDKKYDSRESSRERQGQGSRQSDRRDELKRREPEPRSDVKGRPIINPNLRVKREKAITEIVTKLLDKHCAHLTEEMKRRVSEELSLHVSKALIRIFGNEDVSFIEMVIKFNAKITPKEEMKMLQDVLSSLPSSYRNKKRPVNEPERTEVPAKTSRRTDDLNVNRDVIDQPAMMQQIPEWTSGFQPVQQVLPPPMVITQFDMMQHMPMMIQQPVMVPPPTYDQNIHETSRFQEQPTNQQQIQHPEQFSVPTEEGFNLYLCKDDFEPYSETQAEYLKRFLVSQLVAASENGSWSPDFTIKGLQSSFRYEVEARDDTTKDWFLNMDFGSFALFNVLVYTKEELWYERAAIWLPGHSRCRNIEPIVKLKLQNQKLEGVKIGKWKFVKKIVTAKGTRVYVDMPPSSARALERHKMLLSYELQKVSVFLKAVAVDKEAFDAGLREPSIKDSAEILAAAVNSQMPSLGNDPNIVKICLKGNKAVAVTQARKIKEMLIYRIFNYHQTSDFVTGKTDFVKFGYCLPGYFGVIPENPESKRWLLSLHIGKLNRHPVVVFGADDTSTKYINMTVVLKREMRLNTSLIFERLKQSNQGVKGLNFNLWKPRNVQISSRDRNKTNFIVDMDLESVETLLKMKCTLDYIDDRHDRQHTVYVKYDATDEKLEDVINKLKAEMNDSYDVANMDIASSEEDDDLVYMGEIRD